MSGRAASIRAVPREGGMSLIELVLALVLMVLLMQAISVLTSSALASAERSARQLELQDQARFAAQRIARRIAQTPLAELAPKARIDTSGAWLAPATIELDPASARLIETVDGQARVLAEPVVAFSMSASLSAGMPLVNVALALERDGERAEAAFSQRLGGEL